MPGHHCCNCMIGPSVLASDLSKLSDESQKVLDAGADYLHLDVMDGHFVPNITMGAPVIKCLRKNHPDAFFDCHMMVSHPLKWVKDIAEAGGSMFTFHYECEDDTREVIRAVKQAGMKCGLAVKPGTNVEVLDEFIGEIDMALVMTVEPGFGGQSFMGDMMPKVEYLREKYPKLDIEVDGGLGPATIDAAAKAGANWIVAGSSVYKSPDPKGVIKTLRNSVVKWGHGKEI